MEKDNSTFDQLVKSLSSQETRDLLDNIHSGMGGIEMTSQSGVDEESLLLHPKQKKVSAFMEEPFLLRLWLSIKSFLRSIPIEALYNEQLISRLRSYLKRTSSDYLSVSKNIYTNQFYEMLQSLRKTQLFFSSILTSYDSTKGNFYMLLSSFTTPLTYDKLMKGTNPFSVKMGTAVSTNVRTNFLRKIDSVFSNMNDTEKAEMYKSAQALEWMRAFCSLSLDKTLLRFSKGSGSDLTCQPLTIQPEIEMLSSILSSKKNIPHNLLQTMFLIHSQEKMIDNDERLKAEADEFINDAIQALKAIKTFSRSIPIIDIVRYIKKDIEWEPYKIESGEDWFIYFKQAWYERFNQKWANWSYEQKKYNLILQMMNLLKVEQLELTKFSPWKNIWVECVFKKEVIYSFFKTFFSSFYNEKISDTLKVILVEGNFYRRENLNEFTTSYNVLQHRRIEFNKYETRLSPSGDLGLAFAKIKAEKVATLKNKNKIENLMRTVESEARQIITGSIEALKSIDTILTGIISGSKNSIYATLTNLTTIQGLNNSKFRDQVLTVKTQIHEIIDLHSKAEKLEAEMK